MLPAGAEVARLPAGSGFPRRVARVLLGWLGAEHRFVELPHDALRIAGARLQQTDPSRQGDEGGIEPGVPVGRVRRAKGAERDRQPDHVDCI